MYFFYTVHLIEYTAATRARELLSSVKSFEFSGECTAINAHSHTHTFNALKQIIMLISSFQSSSSLLVAQWTCFEKTHHLQRAALQIRTFVPKWLLCAFVSRQKVCQRLLCLSLIIVWHLLFWIWREWKCYITLNRLATYLALGLSHSIDQTKEIWNDLAIKTSNKHLNSSQFSNISIPCLQSKMASEVGASV